MMDEHIPMDEYVATVKAALQEMTARREKIEVVEEYNELKSNGYEHDLDLRLAKEETTEEDEIEIPAMNTDIDVETINEDEEPNGGDINKEHEIVLENDEDECEKIG